MQYKYVRFFAIGTDGKMEWDSIKDDNDLRTRILSSLDIEAQFEEAGGFDALQRPGDFVRTRYMVFVRCA